jgi:hypothetical protein
MVRLPAFVRSSAKRAVARLTTFVLHTPRGPSSPIRSASRQCRHRVAHHQSAAVVLYFGPKPTARQITLSLSAHCLIYVGFDE